MSGKVYKFVHDENGRCVGAGSLEGVWKRSDLSGTFAGLFGSYDRNGNPDDILAVVKGGGMDYHVVPLAQITDFPQHPGYGKN